MLLRARDRTYHNVRTGGGNHRKIDPAPPKIAGVPLEGHYGRPAGRLPWRKRARTAGGNLFHTTWNTYSRMMIGIGMPNSHNRTGRMTSSSFAIVLALDRLITAVPWLC